MEHPRSTLGKGNGESDHWGGDVARENCCGIVDTPFCSTAQCATGTSFTLTRRALFPCRGSRENQALGQRGIEGQPVGP
jgi:hypothetical protein